MKKSTKVLALAELQNGVEDLVKTWNHLLAFGEILKNDYDDETKAFIDEIGEGLLEEFKSTYRRVKPS